MKLILIMNIILFLVGCDACVSSKVITDNGKFKDNYPLYVVAMKNMTNEDIEYIAIGDNRDDFSPKIYGPYRVGITWYVKFLKNEDRSEFVIIFTYGTFTKYDKNTQNPDYFVCKKISSPILDCRTTTGTIEGRGIATIEKIQWLEDKKEFCLIEECGTEQMSFKLIPNTDYGKIQFSENVNKLLEYIEQGKKFTSEPSANLNASKEQNNK